MRRGERLCDERMFGNIGIMRFRYRNEEGARNGW
jgi:hypothetical protein